MVTVLFNHEPLTPAGKPVTIVPVAPVVVNAIGVMALLIQMVWLVPAAIVFNGLTVIVPVVVAVPHPPVVVTV